MKNGTGCRIINLFLQVFIFYLFIFIFFFTYFTHTHLFIIIHLLHLIFVKSFKPEFFKNVSNKFKFCHDKSDLYCLLMCALCHSCSKKKVIKRLRATKHSHYAFLISCNAILKLS